MVLSSLCCGKISPDSSELNMKILLIEPRYSKVVLDTTSIPLGLASIATVLCNNGHEVKCLDGSVDNIEDSFDYSEYDLIGIQFHSFEAIDYCIKLVKDIKRKSNIPIVAGGVAATFYYQELLQYEEIDFFILYEGENTFLNLANTIAAKGNINIIPGIAMKGKKILDNEIYYRKDINSFPIPQREMFNWQKYGQWSIITSRGCPYDCKFCTVPSFWRHTYRQRSPENIFQEIKLLIDKFGAKKIFILDDSFTVSKSRTIKLLNLIIENNVQIEWACLTRADLLDDDLLKLMKASGCSTISIGVESANQDTLNYLNKNIDLVTIENTIELIKQNGIRVRCSFIFGFPNETELHLKNNITFLKRTKPDEIQIYPLFPYYGTELNRNNEFKNMDFSLGKDALFPILETENLKKETISKYVKECVIEMQNLGYVWISSHSIPPQKKGFKNVIMTEFAPIQALNKNCDCITL